MPDELDNLHGPTQGQAERVYGYMSEQIARLRKASMYINIALISLTVISILLVMLFVSGHSVRSYLIMGAVAIAMLAAACYNVREDLIHRRVLQAFKNGDYFVVEGFVREYEKLREDGSVIDIRFETRSGELLRGVFNICGQGVSKDTELLAVYMPRERVKGAMHSVVVVLTPYLMSQAGWKNTATQTDIWYRE